MSQVRIKICGITRVDDAKEAVDLGGGFVLLFGCAAGDVGIAAVFEVSDGKGGERS